MSFGKAVVLAAYRAQAKGKLSAVTPKAERDEVIIAELRAMGVDTRHGPSRWTIDRHVARLNKAADATCTFCTSTDDADDGMSPPEPSDGEHDMEAAPQALQEITQAVRQWLLTVPHDHTLDQALHPQYLVRLANANRGIRPGDIIQLRPVDMSWIAELMVVSVVKSPPAVATKLIRAPMFLLADANRTPAHIIDQINDLQRERDLGKIHQSEYEQRSVLLQNLRDNGGRYPTPWIAEKLSQLSQAREGGLLTSMQHATARQELLDALSVTQMDELSALMAESPPAGDTPDKPTKKSKRAHLTEVQLDADH